MGCARGPDSNQNLSAAETEHISRLDVNLYPSNKLVCDPWDSTPDPRSNAGLKAELFYLLPSQPRYTKVGDMIANGKKSDRSLFFQSLNVPTRSFTNGFVNDLGEAMKDDAGQTLIEYFALRFKSVIRLAPDQEEGLYEFAVLSDDGSILRFRGDDGVWKANIDNDGEHPTRMGCASEPLLFKRDTERLMEMEYYQGPRRHIANILMMRKAPADLAKDPSCGHASNEDWFDYDHNGTAFPSTPKQYYNDLLKRGWKPLARENFSLPQEALFNPCKDGIAPKITGFRVVEALSTGFVVEWTTDIPATSQVAIIDPATQETTLTTADNVLRTNHQVIITGLKSATFYGLQAISISDTYGKGMTTPLGATTEP